MSASIRFEYQRPGRGVTAYDERLVLDRPDVSVLLLESHAGDGYSINGTIVLARGAPMIWFVFPDGWASVARFHLADGTFTGWYTNLCTPVEKNGSVWSSTDLFLDLWIPSSGEPQWLDEDELREAVSAKLLDNRTVERVGRERERIEALLHARAWPPEACRVLDLSTIRNHPYRADSP